MKLSKSDIIKLVFFLTFIVICFLGVLFVPNNPNKTNLTEKFLNPSTKYIFGTDQFGRCEFSRILYGGWTTLSIVLLGSLIVVVIGTIIGLFLCKASNTKNLFFNSILDAITAIPPIAYLIIFIGILGNTIFTMLIALTTSLILRMIKFVKTQGEIELNKAYVLCAISSGASKNRILFIHVLPNIIISILSYICLSCAEMIMTISGFSFIGLNLGDNVIDWGSMLFEARSVFSIKPTLLFYPILFIFLCTLSFNEIAKILKKMGDNYA